MKYQKGNIQGVVVKKLTKYVDDRGYLAETFRVDELPEGLRPEMSYVSLSEPGIGRGPHEHEEQTDIFAFLGPGNFKVYLWDYRKESPTYGNRMIFFGGIDNPLSVIIPPGVVHAYRNVSRTQCGMVLNYPDKLFAGKGKTEPVDEIRHEEAQDFFYKEFEAL